MRKLILHIGSHKTGTTTIQKTLYLNKEYLKEQGWHLFNINPDGSENHEGHANFWMKFSGEKEHFEGMLDLSILELMKKSSENIILSSEEISWIFSSENIALLADKLKRVFSDIKIVAYFRRQDLHFLSHYQQGFRFRDSTASRFYGRYATPLPPKYLEHFDKYLDYNTKISAWESAFGKENVLISLFDRKTLKDGCLISDFSHKTKIKLNKLESKITNQSLNRTEILLGYYLFNNENCSYEPKDFNHLINNKDKYYPSLAEAENIYKRFTISNEALYSRLENRVEFDVSFDGYPVKGDSLEIHDLETINNLLINQLGKPDRMKLGSKFSFYLKEGRYKDLYYRAKRRLNLDHKNR